MRKPLRITLSIVAVVLLLPSIGATISIFSTAWYSRWQARKLLEAIQPLKPGVTTQAKVLDTLAPYNTDRVQQTESVYNKPSITFDSYALDNYPEWPIKLAPHLPESWNRHIWPLKWTTFSITPRYRDGVLENLTLALIQEHPDDIHPYVTYVRILSSRFEADDVREPDDFSGYSLNPYTETRTDEHGKPIGKSWIIRQYITLDERATPQQFFESTNFQFSCFTSLSPCDDARKLLPTSAVPMN